MKFSKIIGTGSYFPEKILTNSDLEKMVDTSDQWIRERTGIHQRHISTGETTTDMALKAAQKAIEMAGIKPEEIDGVLFPTITPDSIMPCSAAVLQHKLGIGGCLAMDLSTACTGFLYALGVADSFIKAGYAKTILIAAAERLSSIVDWSDRNTCVLFGDGAGAAIVRGSDTPGLRSLSLGADGAYGQVLTSDCIGSTFMANRKNTDIESHLLHMKGSEVFKFAVKAMAEVSIKAVEQSGVAATDIAYLVPHQANLRIIDATAKRLGISQDKIMINLDRRGNTSSATIPTALDEALRTGRIVSGDNIVLSAFGGGLTWGAAVLTI